MQPIFQLTVALHRVCFVLATKKSDFKTSDKKMGPETFEFVTQVLLLASNLLGLVVVFFGADRYVAFGML
eukprot:COSAG06_NODE_440_length_15762_cov_75.979825_2_plen_70_part_00